MRLTEVPMYEAENYQIEELEVEEIVIEAPEEYVPIDPRLEHLSPLTRFIITERYGSDVDEAKYAAERIINTYARPPAWCIELVQPRPRPVKDTSLWRCK